MILALRQEWSSDCPVTKSTVWSSPHCMVRWLASSCRKRGSENCLKSQDVFLFDHLDTTGASNLSKSITRIRKTTSVTRLCLRRQCDMPYLHRLTRKTPPHRRRCSRAPRRNNAFDPSRHCLRAKTVPSHWAK